MHLFHGPFAIGCLFHNFILPNYKMAEHPCRNFGKTGGEGTYTLKSVIPPIKINCSYYLSVFYFNLFLAYTNRLCIYSDKNKILQIMLLIPYLESSGRENIQRVHAGIWLSLACGPRLGGWKKAGTTQLTFLTPLESPGLHALICDSSACRKA